MAASIDAHEAGGKLVRRGGDHSPVPSQGALDEGPQQDDNDDAGAGEHHQALRQDGRAAARIGRVVADTSGGRLRESACRIPPAAAWRRKDRGADGNDDEHDGACAGARRLDGEAAEGKAHGNVVKTIARARRQRAAARRGKARETPSSSRPALRTRPGRS